MHPSSKRLIIASAMALVACGLFWKVEEVVEQRASKPAKIVKQTPAPLSAQKTPAIERTAPAPQAGTSVTMFETAPILFEEQGITIRETSMKYPLVRTDASGLAMVADHLMVQPKPGMTREALEALLQSLGASIRKATAGYFLVSFPLNGQDALPSVMEALKEIGIVEPDYLQFASAVPNDPNFVNQWALQQTSNDADIDAPEAWNIAQGSNSVLVAVIDTGIDLTHPDLAPNLWINSGEIAANGLDDDHNGYIDDINGWDFANDDASPQDDHYHGTHCAGILAAKGNNALGISGVCWNARVMALKFLNSSGSGFTSDAIDAVSYATSMGAVLTSNSWGGGGYSATLENTIKAARDAGSLFIAAAGNSAANNDVSTAYPANYNVENIISVAATDRFDALAGFSSYGIAKVHVAAPGVSILSTLPQTASSAMTSANLTAAYGNLSGTSMATPHVAGVCALLKAFRPSLTATQIRSAVLSGADRLTSLSSKVATGARLNANRSLELLDDLLISPWNGLAATGPVGGPFSPNNATFTISNATNWTASTTQSWLTLNTQSTSVTATINAQANALPPGTHSGIITIQNLDRGTTQTRLVSLTVEGVAPMPFVENWESGSIRSMWKSSGSGRNLVTAGFAPLGTRHLVLDSAQNSSANAINEMTLTLNLSGYTGVRLKFAAKSLSDEPHGPPPSPYTGMQAFDGVAISVNGTTWHEIQPLRTLGGEYQSFDLDLDNALATRGLAYSSTFKVRFVHADNSSAPEDGIALDDIEITGSPPLGMTLAAPAQLREGVSATCVLTFNPAATTGTTTLTSPNADRLIFPTTVTGNTFTITARDDAVLNGNEEVSITATRSGYGSATATLIAQDNESATLTLDVPASVSEGSGVTVLGRVIASRAPARDITVTLGSSASAQLAVPVVATIPAGQTEASFPLIIVDDSLIEAPQNITLSASVPNWTSASTSTQLVDDETFTLQVSAPALMDRFAGLAKNAGLVSLDGTLGQDLIVNLSAAPLIGVTPMMQIVIPAGSDYASFDINVSEFGNPPGSSVTTLTASAAGFASDSTNVTLVEGTSRVWIINQPSHDLAYDSAAGKLVATVPPSSTLINGGIARVLPQTATIENVSPFAEELGMLRGGVGTPMWAATRSGQRLHHLHVNSSSSSEMIELGSDPVAGSYAATDFSPAASGELAVALKLNPLTPRHAGVVIYDGTVARAQSTPRGAGSTCIEFEGSTKLFGYDQETSANGFRTMTVGSTGITNVVTTSGMLSGAATDFQTGFGKIFATSGQIFDSSTLSLVTTVNASGPVCVLLDAKRACWLTSNGLAVFDALTLNHLGTVPLAGLLGTPTSLVPAGADRVAFRTSGGQLCIVRSALIQVSGPARLVVSPTSAAHFVRYTGSAVSPSMHASVLSNPTTSTVNWSGIVDVPWLALSQSSGSLAARATLAVQITPDATSLPLGLHTGTVTFTSGTQTITRTITLSVEPPNTAPTITSISHQISNGDAAIGPLAFTIGDAQTAPESLIVTASTSNPFLTLTLGGSGANRTLTLVSAPNVSGSAVVTLTVADPATTTSTSFNVTVNAVNDPPTLSAISSPVCSEDQSVTGLAFTISDPESPSGDLVVSAASSNPALIPASRIYFGGSGNARTLSLVPLPNQNGTASITITVSDGQLTASRNFTLTVNAVNDPPTLNAPAALLLPVSSPTQMVNLNGISSGAPNEAQTLVVTATSSNTLVVPHPGVIYTSPASTGSLSISPIAGATGSATISVSVNDGSIATVRSFGIRVGVPVITNFSPASGPAGTLVTITGDGFDPVPETNFVYFGAVRAPVLTASTTQLTVFAPAGATNKPVSVTARGMTAQAVRAFRLTFANTRSFAADAFGPVQFLPKTVHTNFSERRVITADLDGNGAADILAKGATGFEFTLNKIADGVLHPGAFDPLVQVPFTSTISGMMNWDYGDLDGDGRLDVVAVGDVGASWFRNNGNGFDPRVSFTTVLTYSVLITDLDGDGKNDVVLGEAGGVAVYRNLSSTTISFGGRFVLIGTASANTLHCEDIDGDGRRDIIAGVSPNPVVCRATGALPLGVASFASGLAFSSPNTATNHRSAVGDFDGDGKIDLVSVGYTGTFSTTTPGSMAFFRNTSTPGSVTMDTRVDTTCVPVPSGLDIADLDGDGRSDVIVTGYGNAPCGVWKSSNTSGSLTAVAFGSRVDLPGNIGGSPTGAAVGDLDGDGRPEIAIGSAGQRVMVWKNQFGDSQPLISAISPTSGPVGTEVTLTGSGFANAASGNVVYFGSRRANVLNASTTSLTVTVPEGATADAISVTVNGTTALSAEVFKTTLITTRVLSAATYTPGSIVGSTVLDTFSYPNPISVADVDDDGLNDVVMTRTVTNSVLIFRNTGGNPATFAAPITLATRELPYEHRVQDIDADGLPDLCVVSSTGSMLCIFRNVSTPGAISFATRLDFSIGGVPQTMECLDYNLDGTLDFVFGDTTYSTGRFFTLLNTSFPGTISFDPAFVTYFGAPAPTYAKQLALRDFDGDGQLDLANPAPSEITTLRGTGTFGNPQFTAAPLVHIWRGGNYLRCLDFDGDGKPDLLSHETSSISAPRLSLGRNRATPGSLSQTSFQWTFANWTAPSSSAIHSADLDGDSRIDLTVPTGTGNKLIVAQNFSTPSAMSVGPFLELSLTHNSIWSASGDLNGDGFIDLVASSSRSAGFTMFHAVPPAATPYILPLANRLIYEDQSTGVIPVRVGMEGVDPALLNLSVSTGTPLVQAQLGGAGAFRTLQLTPAADHFGSATITLTLTHGTQTASTQFTLTIHPVNDAPTVQPLEPLFMLAGTPLEVPLSGITAGPANESSQQTTLSTSTSTPALLSASINGSTLRLVPAAGALGTAQISVTVLDDGGFTYDGRNCTTITTTVQILDAFNYWKRDQFGDDWQNPAVSGDTANLLSYAFKAEENAALTTPQIGLVEVNGQRHVTLSYRRRLDDPAINYQLECSANLQTWQPAGGDFIQTNTAPNGDGTETITLRSIQPINPAQCLMLRLKVTRPAP